MDHRLALLLLLTLSLSLINSRPSQAQVSQHPNLPKPSPSPTIDPATEKKAVDLLESLAVTRRDFGRGQIGYGRPRRSPTSYGDAMKSVPAHCSPARSHTSRHTLRKPILAIANIIRSLQEFRIFASTW